MGTLRELAGRFRLQRVVGSGSSATVYSAVDVTNGRTVAVKVPAPRQAGAARARWEAEARLLATLRHPNILKVEAMGGSEEDTWMVLEYCPGGSLADRLLCSGPVPPAEALGYTLDLLEALTFAHERGVVHRDIKPGNLLIGEDARLRLADFGVARVAGDPTSAARRAGSGPYLAPELRAGEEATPASDLYAVGCSLYALLTGASPERLDAAGPDSPRWDGVPLALREEIRALAAAKPIDRPPDSATAARRLRRLLPAAPQAARSEPGNQRPEGRPATVDADEDPLSPALPADPPNDEVPTLGFRVPAEAHALRPVPAPAARPTRAEVDDPPAQVAGPRIGRWVPQVGGAALLAALGVAWCAPPPTTDPPWPNTDLAGEWAGRWRDQTVRVELQQEGDQIEGAMWIRYGPQLTLRYALAGRSDPANGKVTLDDHTQFPYAGAYHLQLDPRALTLVGEHVPHRGEPDQVVWVRLPPPAAEAPAEEPLPAAPDEPLAPEG